MKTSTILLIGAAGVAAYLFWKSQQKATATQPTVASSLGSLVATITNAVSGTSSSTKASTTTTAQTTSARADSAGVQLN